MYVVVNFLTAVSMPVQSVSPTGRQDATAVTHPTTRIQAPTTTKPGKGQSCLLLFQISSYERHVMKYFFILAYDLKIIFTYRHFVVSLYIFYK